MASGGTAPTPPDPKVVAGLQNTNAKDLYDYQLDSSRVDYTTNTGTANWTKTPNFDQAGYDKAYADWQTASADPAAAYLAANPDVAKDLKYGADPYQHYLEHGKDEGRTWGGPEGAPDREAFTTYDWSASSQLNPEEQGIYDAGVDTRTGIANALTANAGDILANAGPTDYSGVNPLQYSDKMSTDIYDPLMNTRLDPATRQIAAGADPTQRQVATGLDPATRQTAGQLDGALLKPVQTVGDFNQGTPTYDKLTNNYNLGTFEGGPQIRDWGSLMSGLGDDVTAMGGAFDAAADTANQRSAEYANRGSSMRDWAGMLAPQVQGLNDRMANMDPWAYDQQGADAMYRQQLRYAQPQWEDDRKMIEARLGEQGFVPGTPAYNNALQEMLNSQAMERDQARDKATTSGREFGNQAFDNRSGNLQNAIKNYLGLGDLGVATDTGRDLGDVAFGKLGLDYGQLGLDALLGGASTREAGGKLRLGAGELGLDSDTARGDQARNDYETRSKGIVDQFGIDSDLSGFNNKWANQGFNDNLDVADFNMKAAGANNLANDNWADTLISGANYNLDAANANNKSAVDFATTNSDIANTNNTSLLDFAQTNADISKINNTSATDFFDSNVVANTADNNALSQNVTDLTNIAATNNDITQTNNDAREQGLTEADLTQQGDMNWLTSMLESLGIATPPDMLNAGGGNLNGADLAELFQNAFNGDMGAYNADVSSANATNAAGASTAAAIAAALIAKYGTAAAGAAAVSDRRLKTEISPSGKSPKGYPWYKFRYVWDSPGTVREGVMAQDILAAGGDGVLTHPLGFYMVDYSKV